MHWIKQSMYFDLLLQIAPEKQGIHARLGYTDLPFEVQSRFIRNRVEYIDVSCYWNQRLG